MMRPLPFLLAILCLPGVTGLQAKPKAAKSSATSASAKTTAVSQDDAVRLQVFLDAHNFGPGKIDGNYGGFTRKSWQYYQRSQGEAAPKDTFDANAAPLASAEPVYTNYTITAQDLGFVAPVPAKLADQAKQKSMPYASMGELLGERYHSAVQFLAHLNPGKNLDQLKEGDQVKVPNLPQPFELAEVMAQRQRILDELQAKREKGQAEKDAALKKADPARKNAKPGASPAAPAASPNPGGEPAVPGPAVDPASMMLHVSVADAYLEIHESDKIVAGFPITPGSTAIPSPKGEWKIVSKNLLPIFRWDKSMLMTGKRSNDAYIIPPGPNNPVGVAWIALSKDGIGLHGTNEPETIGRAASHGCIRLANWDAFKLFGMVQKGEKVIIE